MPSSRCNRRTGDSLLKSLFGIGLRDVFASGTAAFFHQPKALFKRMHRATSSHQGHVGIIKEISFPVKAKMGRKGLKKSIFLLHCIQT